MHPPTTYGSRVSYWAWTRVHRSPHPSTGPLPLPLAHSAPHARHSALTCSLSAYPVPCPGATTCPHGEGSLAGHSLPLFLRHATPALTTPTPLRNPSSYFPRGLAPRAPSPSSSSSSLIPQGLSARGSPLPLSPSSTSQPSLPLRHLDVSVMEVACEHHHTAAGGVGQRVQQVELRGLVALRIEGRGVGARRGGGRGFRIL
mgnify:CR=1 FL=1